MRIKIFLTVTSLTIVAIACLNRDSAKLDTASYPKKEFSSVTLFTLDTSQKTTIGSSIDTSVLEHGSFFITEAGIPKTKQFHSYQLTSSQISGLQKFLVPVPCGDSLHYDKACAPTFRDVFIFYDKNKIPIAQVHICFECELSAFRPDEVYMCDFDNKVNYKALRDFTDLIKHNR